MLEIRDVERNEGKMPNKGSKNFSFTIQNSMALLNKS